MSSSHGSDSGWKWFKDPRLTSLGFRGIFPTNITPPLIEVDKETDEQNFLMWRIEKGVAEGSTEIPKGEAVPLEYNLAGLNAISFDKGCYVGQELIARTHHREVIRKRIVPLRFLDNNGKEFRKQSHSRFRSNKHDIRQKSWYSDYCPRMSWSGALAIRGSFKGVQCLVHSGTRGCEGCR